MPQRTITFKEYPHSKFLKIYYIDPSRICTNRHILSCWFSHSNLFNRRHSLACSFVLTTKYGKGNTSCCNTLANVITWPPDKTFVMIIISYGVICGSNESQGPSRQLTGSFTLSRHPKKVMFAFSNKRINEFAFHEEQFHSLFEYFGCIYRYFRAGLPSDKQVCLCYTSQILSSVSFIFSCD